MTIGFFEFVLAGLGVLACAAMVGCRPSGPGLPLVVMASGDTAGWIAPCGCTANQSGGLLRRATYVAGLHRQAEVILVDAGGAAHGTSPYDLAKFEAILRGEVLMGVTAHNIGAAEARFGLDKLRQHWPRDWPCRCFRRMCAMCPGGWSPSRCGSFQRAGDAWPWWACWASATRRPKCRCCRLAKPCWKRSCSAAGKYNAAIVLAYLPDDELRQFAEALPEADAVVGGPTGQPVSPKQVGPTLLISATSKGKFLARLDAPKPGSAQHWTGSIVELNEQFADDAEQVANLRRFRQELTKADFTPQQTAFAEPLPADLPKEFAVAGTISCRECHEEDYQLWRISKHSGRGRCSTSKMPSPTRNVSAVIRPATGCRAGLPRRGAAARIDVGCESCHGPSQGHVANSKVRTPYFAQAKNRCTTCHDRENSPKFDYDKYWEQIHHGEQPQP